MLLMEQRPSHMHKPTIPNNKLCSWIEIWLKYTAIPSSVLQKNGESISVTPCTDSYYTGNTDTQQSSASWPAHTNRLCYFWTVWTVANSLLSATASPPSLDLVSVSFIQMSQPCAYRTHKYQILYDMCNAWYMILGLWVHLINCCFIQSGRLPAHHLTRGSGFTQ